jgi:hypothetical protein
MQLEAVIESDICALLVHNRLNDYPVNPVVLVEWSDQGARR